MNLLALLAYFLNIYIFWVYIYIYMKINKLFKYFIIVYFSVWCTKIFDIFSNSLILLNINNLL